MDTPSRQLNIQLGKPKFGIIINKVQAETVNNARSCNGENFFSKFFALTNNFYFKNVHDCNDARRLCGLRLILNLFNQSRLINWMIKDSRWSSLLVDSTLSNRSYDKSLRQYFSKILPSSLLPCAHFKITYFKIVWNNFWNH